jgi:SAM-dependent methyltransferase
MADFARFDTRHYRTVDVRDGYSQWLATYDASVEDRMDLALLDRVETVTWSAVDVAADLGCGTGRTAAWLKERGVRAVHGVDVTTPMLAAARERGCHELLVDADVRASGLTEGAYPVVVCSLVDEHLPELHALYAEATRLLRPAGWFVLVGYHPFFIMASGMPTHFDGADGGSIAIETHVHLPSEHFAAARAAQLVAVELHEEVVDDFWVERKPGWARYAGWPISFCIVWRKD